MQPQGTGSAAYFPKCVDWKEILNDVEQPLIITEGELKASKACKAGFPTIGLGGVWNWLNTDRAVPLLPELEKPKWARRNVYITFDSDLRTNDGVCKALDRLSKTLYQRGALPWMVMLPELAEGEKTGLDDFLVHAGEDEMYRVLREAIPLTASQKLWDLSDEILYVKNPGIIIVRDTGQHIAPGAFVSHAYAHRKVAYKELDKEGNTKLREKGLAQEWLTWPLRPEVGRMTYAPGQPKECMEGGVTAINLWPGWGCEPKKGDVKPFLQLIDHLFTDTEKGAKEWFLKWLAYPIQNPGAKLYTCAVITGTAQGTGKSLVGITMGRIYGKNYTLIGQEELESSFNEWHHNKQFILGDEVTGNNRRKGSDMLKKMITQETVRVNQKYVPAYDVPDRANFLFTSNHPDAFFLEDDDRRYFIHAVTVQPLPREFYDMYGEWLAGDGPSALFYYLQRHPVGDFNPNAHAMRTIARDAMLLDCKSDLGAWVQRLKDVPNEMLRVGNVVPECDLWRAEELLALYDPIGKTDISVAGLLRELRRSAFPMASHGATLGIKGMPGRFFCIRNYDKWSKAPVNACVKHVMDTVFAVAAELKKSKF